ncbi:MAG TPA: nucleotide exchange factor GrpE [Candidatus Kapabacteria bacterium]|nr:nucleotide exchange factor GrpE [Candidatus Kapabacteria bacterium]
MSTRNIPIDEPESNMKDETDAPDNEAAGGEEMVGAQEESPEQRIEALERDNARLRDAALRAVADLENYRRRATAEREQVVIYGNERLLRSLLPIVDDMKRSIDMGGQSRDFDNFFQGVSMINDKFAKLLDGLGVKKIETVGQPFDVNLHEALLRQPSDEPEDTVITELEAGYMFGDRVLRHAKVVVSAGN